MYIDILKKSEITSDFIPVAYVYKNGERTSLYVCINTNSDIEIKEPREIESGEQYEFKTFFYKNPKETQSMRILIYGPQGSGKSYLAGEILDDLFSINSKDIFIFARNEEDEPLDRERICCCDFNEVIDFEKMEKIAKKGKLDEKTEIPKKFINKKNKKYKPLRLNPYLQEVQSIPTEDYKESFLLFDDVERMKTDDATDYLHNLRCSSLEIGRKLNIDCINILHNIKNGTKNSVMRDESNYVFFNPNASGSHKVRSFLKDYCSMDKKEIEQAVNMKGRFICVRTEYPRCLIGKKKIIVI
jgi:hypothetical protein